MVYLSTAHPSFNSSGDKKYFLKQSNKIYASAFRDFIWFGEGLVFWLKIDKQSDSTLL